MIKLDFLEIREGIIPTNIPLLTSSQAHVWQMATQPNPTWDDKLLTEEEKQRAKRYYFDKDRIQYSMSQSFLKIILSHYAQVPPDQIAFVRGPHGKPALKSPHAHIKFNLTHSHNMILYAITLDKEIGVDVEYLNRSLTAMHGIVESQFSPTEQQKFYQLPEEQQQHFFLSTWTLKEAYLKAIGTGIINELNQIEWQVLANEHPRTYGTVRELSRPAVCNFVQFSPTPEYVSTVVISN